MFSVEGTVLDPSSRPMYLHFLAFRKDRNGWNEERIGN